MSTMRPLLRPSLRLASLVLALAASLAGPQASAASLADQPVFTTSNVPGNLALALSVEWPTASRTAHTDSYASSATFLGYFDPGKCYTYVQSSARNDTDTGDTSYFNPTGVATDRRCTDANDAMWSGNFLNWAGTATIDPFRWAMTGGRRVVDTETETILEKGWHSGQGQLFGDRSVPASEVAGATPFNFSANDARTARVKVNGRGFAIRVSITIPPPTLKADYFNNTSLKGSPSVTVNSDTGNHDWGQNRPVDGVSATNFSARFTSSFPAPETGSYSFRVTADDGVRLWIGNTQLVDKWQSRPATSYEGKIDLTKDRSFNLKIEYYQGTGNAVMRLEWKTPSGEWQNFTDPAEVPGSSNFTMRTKVCNPDAPGGVEANCRKYGKNWKPEGLIQQYAGRMRFSAFGYLNDSSDQRDGGVMRSGQKFVGPMQPSPGLPDVDNTQKEWSPTTGIFVRNPNPDDTKATKEATGIQIDDSGVINYLNKFGQLLPGDYKSFDPVSEMYYAVLRYYKNLGNIPAWSDLDTTDTATKKRYLDGFPVVTGWNDPIQYACQRNFILGIGDIYTHVDKNVPGNTKYRTREPVAPAEFATETIDAVKATNKVGALQGLGDLGNSDSYSGRNNSAYIAGLAYDANTVDIRPDAAAQPNSIGKQTVQTYWVDVLEAPFVANNQFYLAAKFGGLKVPANFDPYSDKTTAGTIPLDWWSANSEMLPGNQRRPDNYFTAGRPDTMVDGLTRAFASIANAIKSFTTSFAPAASQVSADGTASYASQYDSNGWSGTVLANRITLAADGTPSSTVVWTTAGAFTTQLAGSGWNSARRVLTWNGSAGVPFRSANLSKAQLANLVTPWAAGDDSANFVNYLRGDRSQEQTATDTAKPYRRRTGLLGDIVNAKVEPVGAPGESFSEALNPGYAAFKKAKAGRTPMVYAAANDGMLHAFNGALTGDNAGKEVFAYVPSALFAGPSDPATPKLNGLAQLGNPNYEHRYYVDATPQAFDVDFNKAGVNYTAGTGTQADWRTILVGGLGKGGRSFYAIDISDPDAAMASEEAAKGKVLWEFSDPSMGLSYGAPIALKTRKYGWVVVLSSGYSDGNGNSDSNGFIYLVNPINGKLIEKISTGSTSAGLAQMTAYIRDFSDGTADAVYAGDLGGQLWRFDLTAAKGTAGAYPAPTKLATLAGPTGTAQPITTQPLVEIDPRTRKRFVLVGTGQLLNTIDINASGVQSFYAIRDGSATTFGETLPSGASYPLTRKDLVALSDDTLVDKKSTIDLAGKHGWYLDLGTNTSATSTIGWRMVTNPTAYSGSVAFSTLLTTGNACSPSGQSRIYVIDFGSGHSVLSPIVAYVASSSAITDLRFVNDSRGSVRLVSGDVEGNLRNVGIDPPGSTGLRLLNWREIPGID